MSDKTVTLPSGRELVVKVAPFSAANKLRKVLLIEARGVDIDLGKKIGDLANLDVANLQGDALNTVKNLFCAALSSEAVENAFFECLARCTIDGQAAKRDTAFEDPKARGDMLPAAWEVIQLNVLPFFVGIDWSSLLPSDPKTSDQQSG